MQRRRVRGVGTGGGRALLPLAVAALVTAVLGVRTETAVDVAAPVGRPLAGHGLLAAVPDPAGTAAERPYRAPRSPAAPALAREGTPTARLGSPATDLLAAGWQAATTHPVAAPDDPSPAGGAGCLELVLPGAGGGAPRERAWVLSGRVVAVRLEAAGTPGLLLPTAVRTGWSLEAVGGAAGDAMAAVTVLGPAGPQDVLVGELPVDSWPPPTTDPPDGRTGAVTAGVPPPPVVELVLGDGGTGLVVSAEVRTPVGRGCTGGPGPG